MSSSIPYPSIVALIRHAESDGNLLTREEQRCFPVGTNKYNLSPRGREQARITGERMRNLFPKPDRVIRSYYARTNETARIMYPNLDIRADPLLAERNRGMWSNATEEEVALHMPWEIRRRDEQGPYHYCPPGGESIPDLERRVRDFRHSIRENYSGKTIVVVGHSQWILLWQKVVHGWSVEETMKRYEDEDWVANASILIYRNEWDVKSKKFILTHDHENDYEVPWNNHV